MTPARSVVRRSRTVMSAAPRAPRSKIRLWSAQRGHNRPEPSGFLAAARRAALVRAALRSLRGLELAVDVVPIEVAEERLDVLAAPVRRRTEVAHVRVLVDVDREHGDH